MPYPYTLLPDGHTLEPEEDEQPQESQPDLPWYYFHIFSPPMPEPDPAPTPAPPPGIDIPGYTPPTPPPAPPPGIDIPGYTPTPGYARPPVQQTPVNRPTTFPPATSVSSVSSVVSYGSTDTTSQSTRKNSDRAFVTGGTGFSADSSLPDYVVTEETLGNIGELRGETDPLHTPFSPTEMEFYLAARHNPLLREVIIATQEAGIPPALQGKIGRYLRYFADFGMDKEDDEEARRYLIYRMYGGPSHYHDIDPLDAAWEDAHDVFDPKAKDEPIEVTNYRAHIETTYGVTFTRAKGATLWDLDLLGLRSAHLAFEKLGSALGEWARRNGLDWDDATAFREIMGEITLHNSADMPLTSTNEDGTVDILGIAQAEEGRTIRVFWKEAGIGSRNYHVDPNVMLHELGHIFNTNVGLGSPFSPVSINKTADHPEKRAGMGPPKPSLLLGKKTIYSSPASTGLPEYFQIIGVSSPDDKIFANVPSFVATQVLSLQQSTDPNPNEITADAILNWSYDQTSVEFGFTDDPDGLKWQQFMDGNMDEWIRYAVAYNLLRSGDEISLIEAEKKHMPFPLPIGRGITTGIEGPFVRSGPAQTYASVSGDGVALPLGRDVIVLGRNEAIEDPNFEDWVAVLYRGDINWIYRNGVQLPDGVSWDELPILENSDKLDFGATSPLRNIESWFPILFRAAYWR